MSLTSRTPDPLPTASALSPVLFSIGDPDLLAELLTSNPAGVVLVEATADLPVVYCNDSFRRWAPPGPRPIVGSPLPRLFSWVDRPAIRAAYQEAIRTGQPRHWRAAPYHVELGGTVQLAYWSGSHYPLRGPAGRVTHVLTFATDVTGEAGLRARMTEAQQHVLSTPGGVARHLAGDAAMTSFFEELSATVAHLVGASRVVFWRYDPKTETLSPEPGAFGFGAEELAQLGGVPCRSGGDDVMERVVFDDLLLRGDVEAGDPLVAPHRPLVERLRPRDTISIPWRSGEHRLGALAAYGSTRPAGFSDEDVWMLQAAATAAALVWEHRRADEALAALREREAAGLRQQIEQSIQLEQLKADFLRLASHELRAPLAVVRGYLSMMEDGTLGELDDSVATVLPLLRAKLDEMNQLVNEMLETARLEDSALQLRLEPLDLREVVREAVGALEPLAGARHRLVMSAAAEPVPVHGDRGRLTMVVSNLVHNAIKYSPAGGDVEVGCAAAGAMGVVSVADHGIGIADADRDRLFTRFGRLVTEQTAGIPGTGLGLYLARDLARRHGGDIDVRSAPGRGSTFTLSLPLG
jgi:signal transduction histidine kinase